MSRHTFSRRKRRRTRKGSLKFYPTYEPVDGKPGALRVRWGPSDMERAMKKARQKPLRTAGGHRYPWDERRSTASKGIYRSLEQLEKWEILKRLNKLLEDPSFGGSNAPAPDALGGTAGPR
jgi:hypothetical protein